MVCCTLLLDFVCVCVQYNVYFLIIEKRERESRDFLELYSSNNATIDGTTSPLRVSPVSLHSDRPFGLTKKFKS